MKRGDLSINYIFLIFIAVIAVFVIVGLITRWSFNAKKFVDILTGPEEEAEILDLQIVNVSDCGSGGERLKNEIVKHAKICHDKATRGRVKGTLCYGIVNPGNCGVDSNEVEAELSNAGIENSVSSALDESKIIIGFNYNQRIIEIH